VRNVFILAKFRLIHVFFAIIEILGSVFCNLSPPPAITKFKVTITIKNNTTLCSCLLHEVTTVPTLQLLIQKDVKNNPRSHKAMETVVGTALSVNSTFVVIARPIFIVC